jgi:hypothetical protein
LPQLGGSLARDRGLARRAGSLSSMDAGKGGNKDGGQGGGKKNLGQTIMSRQFNEPPSKKRTTGRVKK